MAPHQCQQTELWDAVGQDQWVEPGLGFNLTLTEDAFSCQERGSPSNEQQRLNLRLEKLMIRMESSEHAGKYGV